MPGDSRKDYLLATAANFFGIAVTDGAITTMGDTPAMNNFLDDGNSSVVAVRPDPRTSGRRLMISNKVSLFTTIVLKLQYTYTFIIPSSTLLHNVKLFSC